MKEGDFVIVRKMPKRHEWRTTFGVLFTGLSGEMTDIVNHQGGSKTYFVKFKASEYDTMYVTFHAEELKKIGEHPICRNISEPKQKPRGNN